MALANELKKAYNKWRSDGLLDLLKILPKHAYNNYIIKLLPKKTAIYNGIEVPNQCRIFDQYLHWRPDCERALYETGIANSIRKNVVPSDDVIILGGGKGVTAVKYGQILSNDSSVIVYEGSDKEYKNLKQTINYNNLSDIVNINHAVVGPEVQLRGTAGNAEEVHPEELPNCDVLELDCEGAEVDILSHLKIRPRLIIVETHGLYGASTDDVKHLLNNIGYVIEHQEIAEQGQAKQKCIEGDVQVLTATYDE